VHVGYPLGIAALARLRPKPVRAADIVPTVSVVVAAHDEEAVIGERVANLLGLDYPRERLEILVASDGSEDRTDQIVDDIAAGDTRVRLVRTPRGGKIAALNTAVRDASGEVLAFTDANTRWAADALSRLVRPLADDEVGYVCGQLRLEDSGGTNRDLTYWAYELWLRAQESAVGSVTGGNGAIYAVRRADWVEQTFGHDLGLPNEAVRRGRRAIYEPDALAVERQARDLRDEYGRKVRMLRGAWRHVFEGHMLRDVDPLYRVQFVSHRLLRYCIGGFHLAALVSSARLARRDPLHRAALAAQLVWLGLAASTRTSRELPGARLAAFYLLMCCAPSEALVRYLATGAPLVWEQAAGTR
jgi:cellulose synthase/poly-beta-1,6-N-acetylglucosamine synthase-like glycosyltransferase